MAAVGYRLMVVYEVPFSRSSLQALSSPAAVMMLVLVIFHAVSPKA